MQALLTILYRPRATMRRILATERRHVVPMILLAGCSSMLNELQKQKLPPQLAEIHLVLLVLLGIFASILIAFLVFYVLSWVAVAAGRVLEGKGSSRDVRAALAWGTAPIIWALLYRLPAALFLEEPSELRVTATWALYIAILIAEIAVFVWWLVTTSHTLAVAHHFSVPRGFATLTLTLLMPFVLAIAALLTAVVKG